MSQFAIKGDLWHTRKKNYKMSEGTTELEKTTVSSKRCEGAASDGQIHSPGEKVYDEFVEQNSEVWSVTGQQETTSMLRN